MPNVCQKCGAEFYSDTEYQLHLAQESVGEMLPQVIQIINGLSGFAGNYLYQEQHKLYLSDIDNILAIADEEDLTLEQARDKYFSLVSDVISWHEKQREEQRQLPDPIPGFELDNETINTFLQQIQEGFDDQSDRPDAS